MNTQPLTLLVFLVFAQGLTALFQESLKCCEEEATQRKALSPINACNDDSISKLLLISYCVLSQQ